jgi:hydroxypyruvate isomerase
LCSTTSTTPSAWKANSPPRCKSLSRIGHIQLADNPGRNEPGTGEINYRFLFALLDRMGYSGWVGCEYKPATTTWRAWAGASSPLAPTVATAD